MAQLSELQSLEQINYKSKIKIYLYALLVLVLFIMGFLNFFPIGETLKSALKSGFKGTNCNPDFDNIRVEWIMPKVIVTDLNLPASCFNRPGEPLKFTHLTINFNFINFSPLGIPFRIDTEMNGQPLSLYFVQGFGERMLRLKDQSISLPRLEPLFGGNFKLAGNLTVDLNLLLNNENKIQSLNLKAQSKDLQIPSQNIQGFTTPNLPLDDLFIEAISDAPPRINVEKLILGDPESPVRANFQGYINLQEDAIPFSQLNLNGEVAFSQSLKESLPLIDMMFQTFTQKDGFYQIRLGGTLGAPKPSAP